MKILVSDKLSERGLEILRKADSLEVDVKVGLKPEELKQIIGRYHGLIIRSATRVTREIIEAADNLRVIGRAGIGVDNVDLPAANQKGIVVMNTPEGNMITTAEHAFALMMSLARNIPQASSSTKAGNWEKNKFMGVELYQKTLGLIGMGRIGGVMARRAKGFEMNVIAYDPFLSKEMAEKLAVELVDLDTLLARSDFISIHAPKTPETTHMIGEAEFRKMKKGIRLINCARGGIVVESALAKAIREGIVAGAALDVFEEEPPKNSELLGLEEFICTPHLGASTGEAQENVAVAVAEQFVEFFVQGQVRNSVNVPPISAEMMKRLGPYLTLAERMGEFQAQLIEGGVQKLLLNYRGEIAQDNVDPLNRSLLKGFLSAIVGESVNFVNAPSLAKERGIEVVVSTDVTSKNFSSLINFEVLTDRGKLVVEGAVMGMKNEPRVVLIEDCYLEAALNGNLLVFWNKDAPGVIGNVGTYLGNKKINIGAFQLGRTAPKDRAVCIVNVDSPLTAEMLQDICRLPNILKAKMVTL
jgi:D-3-phosphoglycerate dehydrogenase